MTEIFLQYLWKFKLYNEDTIKSNDGLTIKVLNHGLRNNDAGPDFLNAKIKVEDTTWVGNIEVHINSSDWYKHKHHTDPAYDNVILHIVYKHDKKTVNTKGKHILTHELKFNPKLLNDYESLIKNNKTILCKDKLQEIEQFYVNSFLERLTIERLNEKSDYINQQIQKNKGNIEETFYQNLARSFGFKLNSEPFEMLAKSLPLVMLAKHKNSLFQLEAILFGQSGLLHYTENKDDYTMSLLKEYNFLQKKFKLQPLDGYLWKFLRLRPVNFPTIRIAQFAYLTHISSNLFSKVTESETINNVKNLFDIKASEYWDTHYIFGKESKQKVKNIGKNALESIILNTIIPFIFAYANINGNENLKVKMLNWLNDIKAENNRIIKNWETTGIIINSAFKSQAILQLNNNYCTKKRCLDCSIGNKILRTIKDKE